MPDLGPHLLGRKPNEPDDRDWSAEKLHERLGKPLPVPPDTLLDQTLREALSEGSPFLTSWSGILALWRWIKGLMRPHPTPTPSPTPPTTDGPLWERGPVLDQGNFGTCVGNAWAGWGNAAPIEDSYSETDARLIYYESTCIAGACDLTGQEGSTTRDGVKAMKARGKLLAYAFATTIAEIEEWLDHHGPVVIGIDWTDEMFHPDPDGTVHYWGLVQGGHEVVVVQNVRSQGKKRCRNSWSRDWGVDGDFLLNDGDLVKLLAAGGDACLAAEV